MPLWDTDKGDLIIKNKYIKRVIRIEVKGFTSSGPSSFGPKEQWDILYFVDGKNINKRKIKIYEIKLSNKNGGIGHLYIFKFCQTLIYYYL